MGPVAWQIQSEIFPHKIKSVLSSGVLAFFYLISFGVTKLFGVSEELIGIGETFAIFAVFTALGIIFEIFFVPETKNKSLAEIQIMLATGRYK